MPISFGVGDQPGSRNTPTVFNAVFNFRQFWDGRSSNLEEQVAGPIHNPLEMATNWAEVIVKLKNDPDFLQVFVSLSSAGVTQQNIIKAVSQFEKSLITPKAAVDQYLLGDSDALSKQQKKRA